MGFALKGNTVNQIPKGTEIFLENEPMSYVCVVIKGRVLAKTESVKLQLPSGSFLGVLDLSVGHYVSDYITTEDSMIYAFPVQDKKMLRTLLTATNKDYRGLMVNSLTKYFYELCRINGEFHKMAGELYGLLHDAYAKYKGFCREAGEGVTALPVLEQLQGYNPEKTLEQQGFAYYQELAKVPADIQKNFFGCGVELAMAHIDSLSGIITNLLLDTREVSSYIKDNYYCLYNDGTQNLLGGMMKLAMEVSKKSRPVQGLQQLLDTLLEEFNRMQDILEQYMGMAPVVNRARLEKLYAAVLTGEEPEEAEDSNAGTSDEELYQSLRGALQQIIDYSGVPKDNLTTFVEAMGTFVRAKDRMSTEDEFRALRRQIADGFYTLYRACFIKTLKDDKSIPKVIELFLNYGFTDERLLTKEQIWNYANWIFPQKTNITVPYLLFRSGCMRFIPARGSRPRMNLTWNTLKCSGNRKNWAKSAQKRKRNWQPTR